MSLGFKTGTVLIVASFFLFLFVASVYISGLAFLPDVVDSPSEILKSPDQPHIAPQEDSHNSQAHNSTFAFEDTPLTNFESDIDKLKLSFFPQSLRALTAPPNPLKTTKDTVVMFAMIGRDVGHELPYVLRNTERLAQYFRFTYVLFLENDCADNTQEVFDKWATTKNESFNMRGLRVNLKFETKPQMKNLSVLARARTAALEVLSNVAFNNVDFIIPLDSDMCFPWSVHRMTSTLNSLIPLKGTKWDILHGNGICGWYCKFKVNGEYGIIPGDANERNYSGGYPVYCDLFAFRMGGRSNFGWNDGISFMPGVGCETEYLKMMKCEMHNNEPLVPVDAAFGGIGFYPRDVLIDKNNRVICEYKAEPCEHTGLTNCLSKKFPGLKQMVSPNLVVHWEGCERDVRDDWVLEGRTSCEDVTAPVYIHSSSCICILAAQNRNIDPLCKLVA